MCGISEIERQEFNKNMEKLKFPKKDLEKELRRIKNIYHDFVEDKDKINVSKIK